MKRQNATIMLLLLSFSTVGCSLPSAVINEGSKSNAASEPTIRIVANSLGMNFPAGMDENHNPYLDYIEKNIGVQVNVMLPPLNGYDEKLNVIMTSGEPPDLLSTSDPSVRKVLLLRPPIDWLLNVISDVKLREIICPQPA